MKDRDEREEYILNESGIIWRGTHEKMKPTPWNFAQVCLKLSVLLIINSGFQIKIPINQKVFLMKALIEIQNVFEIKSPTNGWFGFKSEWINK